MKYLGLSLAILMPLDTVAANGGACFGADALLDAGMLEEATSAYIEILNGSGSAEAKACADEALPRLRDARIARNLEGAKLFLEHSEYDSAAEALGKALAISTTSDAVVEALEDFYRAQPKDRPAARAAALANFGLYAEARDVLTETYKTAGDPAGPIDEVPEDLQYLSGGRIDWWRNVKRGLPTHVVPILELLAALVAIIILVRLLVRAARAKPQLQIREFSNGGFEAAHLGAYFSNNVLNRFESLKSGSGAGHVELVSGPIEPIAIPSEVSAVIPDTAASWLSPLAWARAIPALFAWMFPRRLIALTGELHTLGNRGIGVTVRLIENERILVGYAFWEKDFDDHNEPSARDDEEKLYQLADYVAVWLLFEAMSRFDGKQNLLGTGDWRGYALFRAGCNAERGRRSIAARHLYERALDRDPGLRGARVNLGRLLIDDEPAAAKAHLTQVREEAIGVDDARKDPTLYSAIYYLAALTANDKEWKQAAEISGSLIKRIDEALADADENLRTHLRMIRPAANTMRGALLILDGDPEGRDIVDEESDLSSRSALHQFNLACAHSIIAGDELKASPPNPALAGERLDAALAHLRRSFQLNRHAVPHAAREPLLSTLEKHRADRFRGLLEEYGEANETVREDPALPLAVIDIVSEVHAEALAGLNIRTAEELLLRTRDSNERKALADALTISPRIVTQWAHAADLMRILGIGPEQVNLLRLAGVTSIVGMLRGTAADLAEDLGAIASATGHERPEPADVRRWMEDARMNTWPLVT